MKKTIILLVIATMIAALFMCTSCTNSDSTAEQTQNTANTANETTELILLGEVEDGSLIAESGSGTEDFLRRESYARGEAPKSVTKTVFGESLTAEYSKSVHAEMYNSEYDYYLTPAQNGEGVFIRVDQNSGRMVYAHWPTWKNGERLGKQLSYDECKQIANDALATLVTDSDSYKLSDEEPNTTVSYKDGDRVYGFTFEKALEGFPMVGKVFITVNSDGDLSGFEMDGIDAFSGTDLDALAAELRGLDDTDALIAKTKELCKNDPLDVSVHSKTLYRLRDGSYGILYEMKVTVDNMYTSSVLLYRPLSYTQD